MARVKLIFMFYLRIIQNLILINLTEFYNWNGNEIKVEIFFDVRMVRVNYEKFNINFIISWLTK